MRRLSSSWSARLGEEGASFLLADTDCLRDSTLLSTLVTSMSFLLLLLLFLLDLLLFFFSFQLSLALFFFLQLMTIHFIIKSSSVSLLNSYFQSWKTFDDLLHFSAQKASPCIKRGLINLKCLLSLSVYVFCPSVPLI